MEYRINHNDTEIKFTVEFRNRRSTSIQVRQDQSVRVLAPKLSSRRTIIKIVSERAPWIIKKQREFALFPIKPEEYTYSEGEVFSFLGADFVLKTEIGKSGVILSGNELILTTPEGSSTEERKKILGKWYRQQSEIIFAERFGICLEKAKSAGITDSPEWKSRRLKRSWGSCTAKRGINLNLGLVSAPVECIDFVILHELCHLREPNHSRRFYNLLESLCPEWKQRKKILNENYRTGFV